MALSHKQKAFVEHYLMSWNASDAARQAAYSERSARVTGHRLLTNANVQEEIQRRVAEMTLTANETLVRLAEHARGDMGDFMHITENGPRLDLQPAALMGKTRLIRKVKTKTRTYRDHSLGDEDEDNLVTEVDTEIELYNAQSALELIAKHHGLLDNKSGTEEQPFVVKMLRGVDTDDL